MKVGPPACLSAALPALSAGKFKTRYATIGFEHEANLDEGYMWPVAFALKDMTAAEETRIAALVKKAVG